MMFSVSVKQVFGSGDIFLTMLFHFYFQNCTMLHVKGERSLMVLFDQCGFLVFHIAAVFTLMHSCSGKWNTWEWLCNTSTLTEVEIICIMNFYNRLIYSHRVLGQPAGVIMKLCPVWMWMHISNTEIHILKQHTSARLYINKWLKKLKVKCSMIMLLVGPQQFIG